MSNIKLILGDCLEEMKKIPDNSIDLVLTDPPYGISYQSNMRTQTEKFAVLENDNNDFRFSIYPIIYQKLKDNSVAIVFCSFKNYAFDYIELSKLFDIKNCIIWDKGGGGIGDLVHSLLTDYEMALICHKGNCPIRGKREGSVWNCGKVTPSLMKHPTQKPEGICNKLITKFSDNNAIVLDPFMGSGTTGVACQELGRNFIGIEINEKYFKIAERRINQSTKELFV
jgi:site-specific DNA-methyltransferase (adenine-specific)